YQWGGQALIRQAVPKGHFAAAPAGSGPDYALSISWIARPGLADNPAIWSPGNGRPPDSVTRIGARVFYIHPTTYLERDRWNAPLFSGGDTEFRTRLFVQ